MTHRQRVSALSGFFFDRRLEDRLHRTFDEMARRPVGSLPQKLLKRAELVGGYRLFNNPKVTHQTIMDAHRASCLEQLNGYQGKALLLHDTTVLDYSGLDVDGLGQVGNGHGKGLYAHNSLLILPQTRQVVGLMNQVLHKRRRVPKGESKSARRDRPDCESRLWKKAVASQPAMPAGVRVIDVSDRGSDISEYIDYQIKARRQFIVRSQHNRKLVNDRGAPLIRKLHDRLRRSVQSPMGQYTLRVPAVGKRKGKQQDASEAAEGWRETSIALAWERVQLLPPRQPRGEHGSEPMEVWAVIAREVDPPPGADPIEWILLTNLPVESAGQAKETVDDYAFRWMIEDYHKAKKTGCGIEELQMTTRHGLDNAIALLSVLAVHVLRLRCNARNEVVRQQPARLHEEPLKVQLAARDARHPDWRAMTVFEFYLAVAKMGGYQLNPHKHPPGWIILWRGYIRLENMCDGVRLMGERCVQT